MQRDSVAKVGQLVEKHGQPHWVAPTRPAVVGATQCGRPPPIQTLFQQIPTARLLHAEPFCNTHTSCPLERDDMFQKARLVLTKSILIQRGIPAHLRRRAAEVYDDAFAKKLRTFLGTREQRIAILEESFATDYAFVALSDGDLVGIAGFHAAHGQLLDIGFGALRRHLGWYGRQGWAASSRGHLSLSNC